MTPPPINIDGTNENYSNVTIDGQDVTQITIDGQDVLSTIPDSDVFQNPIYQWWAGEGVGVSDGQTASVWDGQLAQIAANAVNSPLYRDSQSGKPAIEYDSVDANGHTFTPDTQLPTGAVDISIAALVYAPPSDDGVIFTYGAESPDDRLLVLTLSSGVVTLDIRGGGLGHSGSTSYPEGQWITVGGKIAAGAETTVYLNGSNDGSDAHGTADIANQNHGIGIRPALPDHSDLFVSEVLVSASVESDQAFADYHSSRLG